MNLMNYVGNRIKELRQSVGASQEELGKAIGVATNTVSRWETATYKPRLEDLDKLARHFGVSILEFFPREETPQNEKISALLRAAESLHEEDIDELQKYAEFRRARSRYNKPKSPGRKRKDES